MSTNTSSKIEGLGLDTCWPVVPGPGSRFDLVAGNEDRDQVQGVADFRKQGQAIFAQPAGRQVALQLEIREVALPTRLASSSGSGHSPTLGTNGFTEGRKEFGSHTAFRDFVTYLRNNGNIEFGQGRQVLFPILRDLSTRFPVLRAFNAGLAAKASGELTQHTTEGRSPNCPIPGPCIGASGPRIGGGGWRRAESPPTWSGPEEAATTTFAPGRSVSTLFPVASDGRPRPSPRH